MRRYATSAGDQRAILMLSIGEICSCESTIIVSSHASPIVSMFSLQQFKPFQRRVFQSQFRRELKMKLRKRKQREPKQLRPIGLASKSADREPV